MLMPFALSDLALTAATSDTCEWLHAKKTQRKRKKNKKPTLGSARRRQLINTNIGQVIHTSCARNSCFGTWEWDQETTKQK